VRGVLVLALALVLIGCGRLRVSALTDDAALADDAATEALEDGAPDAPPIPVAICDVARVRGLTTPAVADLAVASVAEGYAAVWVDTASSQPAQGAVLGPNLQPLSMRALPEIRDLALGGLADVGKKLVLASATGTRQNRNILERDLTMSTVQAPLDQRLMARDPYPELRTGGPHAFVSAQTMQIVLSNVADDGLVDPAIAIFAVPGTITELACGSGPTHAHCIWAEQLSAPDSFQCTIGDIYFNQPAPDLRTTTVSQGYCAEIRNASALDAADTMIVVWTTQTHSLEARYGATDGDKLGTISAMGFAPRVIFDGARFWIAYFQGDRLDANRELRLASFDLDGTIVDYSLAGWKPIGDEAFELVRRGTATWVVILSAGELDFLKLCS
jgi:hypothetical protein